MLEYSTLNYREEAKMFSYMRMLCLNHKEDLSGIHQKRKGQYATEPIIGAAMGAFGIEPLGVNMEVGSLMVSTWRARNCHFDLLHGVSHIEKPRGFYFNIPLPAFAKGWVSHSPIFAHFIDLKPVDVYQRVVRQVTSSKVS